ncbi:hypothetical protein PPACK8108_LOCUS23374 [Phakopsora pachyrhizi]|uniref:Uncharacterized protein n=1 Tax=Phakopsora pachyrhizi TaxID=170000 RepID=A0AAV0BM68_PHAPC|nr:hypothetical protein PPACK8108_LOCUS23374 [Phakopsora pachyrhizi]
MGVPAPFRWLSRKYPRISEQLVEDEAIGSQVERGHGKITSDMSQKNSNRTEFGLKSFTRRIDPRGRCILPKNQGPTATHSHMAKPRDSDNQIKEQNCSSQNNFCERLLVEEIKRHKSFDGIDWGLFWDAEAPSLRPGILINQELFYPNQFSQEMDKEHLKNEPDGGNVASSSGTSSPKVINILEADNV